DVWGERPAQVTFQPEFERATLHVETPLEAGGWSIDIEFSGILNDRLRGFYRSTYVDPEGVDQVIATTQFESTDARRAFPCWDEPDFKATFGVTLVVDDGLAAISNGAEVRRSERDDGKVVVEFAPTMKMSTYLVAFVVGRLEATAPVMVSGVPLRVVHLPGKGRYASFALEAGAFALDYLAGYYGIPYPAGKLDLVGIPDFAWGAMENLGCVTFRETALLVDPAEATQSELQRVADVIAHEIAHMWFGDLVTMKWWNGIWLNEAFATFMELKTVDAFRPEWNRWVSFAAEGGVGSSSMDIDSLEATRPIEFPVESPDDADAMFDALTYGKGAAVLRMLEQFLGEEKFRTGVSDYLQWFTHGNAETKDLWKALEQATGVPVAEMMDTWIFQGGVPIVEVAPGGPGAVLTQDHFRYLGSGEGQWTVPVLARSIDDPEITPVTLHGAAELPYDTPIVNAGGHGFYRVRYDKEIEGRIHDRLDQLLPLERYALIADSWGLTLGGRRRASDHVRLLGLFRSETEPLLWEPIAGSLATLSGIATDAVRPAFAGVVRDLVGDAVLGSGWEVGRSESDLERRLRGTLLRTMGVFGDDESTIERARATFEAVVRGDVVDPDVASASLTITAAHGLEAEYHRFWEEYERSESPQDQVRYLRAMATVPGDALAAATMD
ncbi:MAG: M1 family metallopeptidase, partial [Acidimicrobiia bacterium]|nr:M1 family metallopeptidase [Acidimicrobiia bacterium]